MWLSGCWNVNSLKARLPHVLQWLADHRPDVLALQETKLQDENFPAQAFIENGYHAAFVGEKAYNGVAVISKTPPQVLHAELPGFTDPQKRVLVALVDGVCVVNLYVPNGSETGSEKYAYKLEWLARLDEFIGELQQRCDKLLLMGDFNIAPGDEDVHDPAAWRDKVLCSRPEREALARLLARGFTDAYRLFEQEENSFSWWDYRGGGFTHNRGLRIDLILADAGLSRRCADCWIDTAPRRLERPSDHAPVAAEFRLAHAEEIEEGHEYFLR